MTLSSTSYRRAIVARRLLWLGLLLAALVAAGLASLVLGARVTGWADLRGALSGVPDTMGQAAVASRIPRSALAALAGAALGLAGAAMQGLTRNPLADPGILGVNAGAALAVVNGLATVGLGTAHLYLWWAILGAGVAAIAV